MGNAHRSGKFVKLRRNSSFFVGTGKDFKGLRTFSKATDARLFCVILSLGRIKVDLW